jgi:hypothetical protein
LEQLEMQYPFPSDLNPLEHVEHKLVLLVWQISQFLALQFLKMHEPEDTTYPKAQNEQEEGVLHSKQFESDELQLKQLPEVR